MENLLKTADLNIGGPVIEYSIDDLQKVTVIKDYSTLIVEAEVPATESKSPGKLIMITIIITVVVIIIIIITAYKFIKRK